MTVQHDAANHRFSVRLPEGSGNLYYRKLPSGGMDLYRTEVDPGLRGKGVAGELTTAAVGYAREHDIPVKASCAYVAGWLKRHPAEGALRDHVRSLSAR